MMRAVYSRIGKQGFSLQTANLCAAKYESQVAGRFPLIVAGSPRSLATTSAALRVLSNQDAQRFAMGEAMSKQAALDWFAGCLHARKMQPCPKIDGPDALFMDALLDLTEDEPVPPVLFARLFELARKHQLDTACLHHALTASTRRNSDTTTTTTTSTRRKGAARWHFS